MEAGKEEKFDKRRRVQQKSKKAVNFLRIKIGEREREREKREKREKHENDDKESSLKMVFSELCFNRLCAT